MRDACSDPRLTDYQYRLFSAIANRIDVEDGKTRPVSDVILANESRGKRHSALRGRKALKRLGYIDWQKEPVQKFRGLKRNIYWVKCDPTVTSNVILESHDIQTQNIQKVDRESVRTDVRPPYPIDTWRPDFHDIGWARWQGYSDQQIVEITESVRSWAIKKGARCSDWSEVWRESFRKQSRSEGVPIREPIW